MLKNLSKFVLTGISAVITLSLIYVYSIIERSIENNRYATVVSSNVAQNSSYVSRSDIRSSVFLVDTRTGHVVDFERKISDQSNSYKDPFIYNLVAFGCFSLATAFFYNILSAKVVEAKKNRSKQASSKD